MNSDNRTGTSADTAAEDGPARVLSSPSPLDIQQRLHWSGNGRGKEASLPCLCAYKLCFIGSEILELQSFSGVWLAWSDGD